jgi:hypothetical protein
MVLWVTLLMQMYFLARLFWISPVYDQTQGSSAVFSLLYV